MNVVAYGHTDIGRQRDHNEDAMSIDSETGVYIVCDGVGGYAAGEVASQTTVGIVQEAIRRRRSLIDAYRKEPSFEQRVQMLHLVEEAIQEACMHLYTLAQEDPTKKGMSTTIAMLLILGEAAVIAHVGDSRVYVIREGQAHQLTEDHSLVWEQLKNGRITKQEADHSPFSNVITRSVGRQHSVQVDTLFIELMAGDQFVLCSDGFHEYLEDETELAQLSATHPVADLPSACVNFANRRGGKDNITVVVLQVASLPDGVVTSGVTVSRKVEALKRLPLFRYCNYQELVKILRIVRVRVYQSEQTIIAEETEGNDLFVVLSGQVLVLKKGQVLTTLGPGAHFGEMALIDRVPRSATIKADGQTRVMVIGREHFYALLKQEARLAVKLLWSFLHSLNARLRATSDELTEARGELSALSREINYPLFSDEDLPWS